MIDRRPIDDLVRRQLGKTEWKTDAREKGLTHLGGLDGEDGGDISRSLAARIRCPALLLAGTYDKFCSPENTRELAEVIPRGQFAEAHGAGHDIHISHGDWLSATALRWLAGH